MNNNESAASDDDEGELCAATPEASPFMRLVRHQVLSRLARLRAGRLVIRDALGSRDFGEPGGAEALVRIRNLSAYADLANPRTVNVRTKAKGCIVLLKGGDASASYDVEIGVDGDKTSYRTVRSGEFPNFHYERTTYVNKRPPF